MSQFDTELNEHKDLAKKMSTLKNKEILRETLSEY